MKMGTWKELFMKKVYKQNLFPCRQIGSILSTRTYDEPEKVADYEQKS